ncbi:MAG TPA: hypothetical protein VN455_13460 [Methanotrichaceae archaeon]|nr:hypothetical protein [Methanotrichaceae archaeon]
MTSITTSRDPSARARRFGKALARFLSVPYVNRGKQSLDRDQTWIMVAEKDGNPSSLVKRTGDREDRLDFRILLESSPKGLKRDRPVVTGSGDAGRIAEFFDLDCEIEPGSSRTIRAETGRLEFFDQGELALRLAI